MFGICETHFLLFSAATPTLGAITQADGGISRPSVPRKNSTRIFPSDCKLTPVRVTSSSLSVVCFTVSVEQSTCSVRTDQGCKLEKPVISCTGFFERHLRYGELERLSRPEQYVGRNETPVDRHSDRPVIFRMSTHCLGCYCYFDRKCLYGQPWDTGSIFVGLTASCSLSSQQLLIEGAPSPPSVCLTSYSSIPSASSNQKLSMLTESLASSTMHDSLDCQHIYGCYLGG
jgi:hypothetical protein